MYNFHEPILKYFFFGIPADIHPYGNNNVFQHHHIIFEVNKTNYFLRDEYKKDINESNPLGSKGKLYLGYL